MEEQCWRCLPSASLRKLSDGIGDRGGDVTELKLPDQFLAGYVRGYDLVDVE